MQIAIMGKEECIKYTHSKHIKPCVILSINDWGSRRADLKDHEEIKDVLTLFFDDIIPQHIEWESDEGLFQEAQAKQIYEFVEKWRGEVQQVIVHCSYGISRSSAVAAGICRQLSEPDEWIWACNQYDPNPYVFEKVVGVIKKLKGEVRMSDKIGHTLCRCQGCHYDEWIKDEEIFEAYRKSYLNDEDEIILICPQCGGEMRMRES